MLSDRDENLLIGAQPDVIRVVRRAAILSPNTFRLLEVLRSLARQRALFASGASKTLKSYHITGHAYDALPVTDVDSDGKKGFDDWDEFYPLAETMRAAAIAEGVRVTWGGVWDIPLNEIQGPLKAAVAAYVARRKKIGRSAFLDGPHFQIDRA